MCLDSTDEREMIVRLRDLRKIRNEAMPTVKPVLDLRVSWHPPVCVSTRTERQGIERTGPAAYRIARFNRVMCLGAGPCSSLANRAIETEVSGRVHTAKYKILSVIERYTLRSLQLSIFSWGLAGRTSAFCAKPLKYSFYSRIHASLRGLPTEYTHRLI